jgi:hypothetical protein
LVLQASNDHLHFSHLLFKDSNLPNPYFSAASTGRNRRLSIAATGKFKGWSNDLGGGRAHLQMSMSGKLNHLSNRSSGGSAKGGDRLEIGKELGGKNFNPNMPGDQVPFHLKYSP